MVCCFMNLHEKENAKDLAKHFDREIERAIEFGCNYFVAGINDEEEKLFAKRVEKAASYYADGEIHMIGIEDFKSVDEMKKFFIEIADYEIYSYEEE